MVNQMEKKYSIGEVSKTCSIPVKTLHYYDEIGLVIPQYRNEESKYRYYSKQQMVNLFIIRQLKTLGFSLKDIKELFEDAHLTKFEQKISQRLNEIDEEIKNLEIKKTAGLYLRNRILQGGDILAHYNEDIDSTQNDSMGLITVEYIPQGQLFYSRDVMEKYQNSEVSLERWIDITENCRERNLSIISPIIVTYYSNVLDQYLMKDCDVEFGVMVEGEKIQEKESVRLFGGFEAVTKIHVGSYGNIMESHVRMIQWINKNDYEISGPISEEFIVSPVDIDNENEHITKIIIPVKKK